MIGNMIEHDPDHQYPWAQLTDNPNVLLLLQGESIIYAYNRFTEEGWMAEEMTGTVACGSFTYRKEETA